MRISKCARKRQAFVQVSEVGRKEQQNGEKMGLSWTKLYACVCLCKVHHWDDGVFECVCLPSSGRCLQGKLQKTSNFSTTVAYSAVFFVSLFMVLLRCVYVFGVSRKKTFYALS